MKLLSVNVSLPKEVVHDGKTIMTGIYKEPVGGRVMVRALKIDGDGQANLQAHGGTYKAVYAYGFENYAYWETELGRDDLSYGQFGENLTTEGITDDEVHIGDVFRIGGALLRVTQSRNPCAKIVAKMGVKDFAKRFIASGRVGFYLSVLEEGEIGAGDDIERVKRDPEGVSIGDINRLRNFDRDDLDGLRRALRSDALAPELRQPFEQRLAKAEALAAD
ncbi:MAG: MOSC domain-containing protein [Alphaproteobacteria bacterium]|nr:MAG: MOSC domain-containing protein [Alphaproteobacteria bacterium]